MDLQPIEDDIVQAAEDHPAARTVLLETGTESIEVRLAIMKPMSTSLSPGAAALLQGTFQSWTLLRRFCSIVPSFGMVIVDGSDRWTIQQIGFAYGRLAYQCSCVLQT